MLDEIIKSWHAAGELDLLDAQALVKLLVFHGASKEYILAKGAEGAFGNLQYRWVLEDLF